MALSIFPMPIFNPTDFKAGVRHRVIEGGTALNGVQDTIAADGGGRWVIEASGIILRDTVTRRAWNQWDAYMQGGARVFSVPLLTLRDAPRPQAGGRPLRVSDLSTDDPVFPTEVKYASPYIAARVVNALAIGDVQAVIRIDRGSRLDGGEIFSVGDRAYVVERVLSRSGQSATVRISPPVRTAILADSPANFEWPRVQCRAVIGQDIIPTLSQGYGTVSISFVEDFSVVS